MKLLKFTLISILGLSLCTACGGDGDGGETPGPGKPEGPDKSSTTGIDRFDASNIFSRNTYLPDNTAMQGFNLDSDGSVWYTQLSNTNQAQLNWVRAQPNKTPDVQTENKDYMKLTYFGHGTNTALEEDGADRYLWAGAYGVCNAKGQYWNEKLVGRVKYVKGATVKTNECNDYYYIGDYTDLHPSIDAENDLLTINYGDSKNSSYRCFVIYKLSEAKKAPMTNVTITCTDGFQTDRPASTNPVSVVVRCHDLTTLTPVARPRFLKTGYGASGATYYDWQGYDVHKNRLYYAEGQSNYNLFGSFYSGSSFAYVTVFDFEGNIVEERTQVAVVLDKDKLTQIGVSVFGTLEAEGIKVCKDKLYLGYTARGITADNTKHYQNIFVFDPSSRKPVSEKPVLRAVAGDGRRGRGLRPETGHAQRFRLHKITYMRGTRPFQTACNPHMWRYRASGPATTVRIEVADSFGRTSTKTMTRPKAFHIRMR